MIRAHQGRGPGGLALIFEAGAGNDEGRSRANCLPTSRRPTHNMESASRIPEKLFFRIGEVCDLIKVQPHVLRYWETEFPMLAPQKNRAGQRVYRRKDVEMVLRIRDLLYEEKFTIAGAKKRLLDESRGGASRVKLAGEGTAEKIEPSSTTTVASSPTDQSTSPQTRGVLRVIKRDLEDLLTRLNTDASIKR
jgi:DNA-binding transcriptional MerR regulator